MKRVIAAFVVAALLAYGALRLHQRRLASMAEFERGSQLAAGDAGAP
jgi:hypothetical protein